MLLPLFSQGLELARKLFDRPLVIVPVFNRVHRRGCWHPACSDLTEVLTLSGFRKPEAVGCLSQTDRKMTVAFKSRNVNGGARPFWAITCHSIATAGFPSCQGRTSAITKGMKKESTSVIMIVPVFGPILADLTV